MGLIACNTCGLMKAPGLLVDGRCPGCRGEQVEHPAHYHAGGIECIDALKAALTPEEFKGFLKGSCLKYIWRARHKGAESQDYAKSRWYLDRLIAEGQS